MNVRTISTSLVLGLLWISSHAQEVWPLERCIQHALDNSLTLKQSKVDAQQAEVNHIAAKQSRIPQINGSTGYNVSFGRQIDPVTNDFINQNFGSQNLGLQGGVTLFNGGRVSNQIKQAALGKRAAELEADQMSNDISLQVAQAYLAILFAIENHANSEKNLELIQAQLEQTDKLIEAGTRPKNERLDLVAQVATNEQLVVAAQNEIDRTYLDLKQLLQLDGSYDLEVDVPELSVPTDYEIESLTFDEVYSNALGWLPSIKAGELRRENAEIGVQLARTNMIPNITIGGSISTNYGTFTKRRGDLIGTETIRQEALVNGEPFVFEIEQDVFAFDKVPYTDQLNENLGYGFGISANIPIYNQGRNKAQLEISKLDVVRTEIANDQTKNLIKTDVQTAINDVKAARKAYEASQRTAEANRAAYSDAQKRYELGVANSFEFTTAQNNRDQAEVNLIIAKYDYIFRSKILDFYQGKKITLN